MCNNDVITRLRVNAWHLNFPNLEKEVEGVCEANGQRDAAQEHDLSVASWRECVSTGDILIVEHISVIAMCTYVAHGQQALVEEQQHAKQQEHHAKGRQPNANLCARHHEDDMAKR